MRSEGGSETSPDPDAAHAPQRRPAQRPASNLLLVGTGLSLALAVVALLGLSPAARSPASPPGTSRTPTVRVAVDDLGPPAIDQTRVGGITIQEIALSPSSPWSSWTAPEPFGAAHFGSPRPSRARIPAAGPPRPAVSFAPANLEKPNALGNPTGPNFSGVWTAAIAASTFVGGRMTPSGDASSAGRIARFRTSHEQGTTSRGTTSPGRTAGRRTYRRRTAGRRSRR